MSNNPDMCKEMLEILLQKKIDRIISTNGEQFFAVDFNSKGVRLDVYIKDEDSVYDIEIQTVDTKELAKRPRYYQGIMDVDNLKAGQNYRELKDSYVIFLCLDDIFGKHMPCYSFENICTENNEIRLNDRSFKIFFNASLYDIMNIQEQKDFFKYVLTGKADSSFTEELKKREISAKQNARWRQQYMTWEMEMLTRYEDGKQAGLQEGLEKG